MSTLKPNLTFRVVRMLKGQPFGLETRFVAIAWNYDHGQLMATVPCLTYTDARRELDALVVSRGCALRWFDGEYECAGDGESMIVCVDAPTVDREVEETIAHQA